MSKPISQQSKTIEPLTDRFGRRVEYLRLSVTDRCDFRCVYCMEEEMIFVPRSQVLSLEEMALVARVFVELGVKKIRLTGGEPLIRQGIIQLCEQISALPGLHELVLTTNGSQLTKLAAPLKRAGVKRLNISLDSLNAAKFKELTRTGDLQHVLEGIDAARAQGFDQIKLNAVILKGRNDEEVLPLVNYALARRLDISFIEEMPLGIIQEHSRKESFISSESLREMIEKEHVLRRSEKKDLAGGPSRYWNVEGFDSRIGFISPHSENFCADCNRVRVTTEGRLLLCLGNEHSVDLREVMRSSDHDPVILKQALVDSMQIKPEKHFFDLDQKPDIIRFMNATGG